MPYDVLRHLFDLLPSPDLVHVLCSCRTLYNLANDQSIWRSMAARYGLHDISYFGGRSWFVVYTGLLHTYGPMLGLWAGDHPYTGNIIEIRLHAGNSKRQGGIVVDAWRFRFLQPEELDTPEMPEPPTYKRLARIEFAQTPSPQGPAKMICQCDRRRPPHSAAFGFLSPSTQGFGLHTRQGQFLHPDFPCADCESWVAPGKYPRIGCQPSMHVDQSARVTPRVPTVYALPSTYRSPSAVVIHCAWGCVNQVRPFLGFDNITPHLPRYYPLRHDVHPYVDPTSSQWTPSSITGLWLGSHGPHGTEALYLDLASRLALRAWKITGDENVPRGAISWQANMENPLDLAGTDLAMCLRCLGDLDGFKFFGGTGTLSGRGFMPHQQQSTPVILAVGPKPLLRVVWVDGEEVSAYMRCPILAGNADHGTSTADVATEGV
ncbi:hypothetical protein ONZ51_g464 [Trametes cubensis]|uniref:F-box domain-containing protein n=1 Tax=Trametes cubensis TaxID=1111947 RepID=A0AAD7U3E9_9APHY|nr:hypothetical protein ONZ51_g464 [Trametes cubensis]